MVLGENGYGNRVNSGPKLTKSNGNQKILSMETANSDDELGIPNGSNSNLESSKSSKFGLVGL